jgi:hypothetical protein
MLTPAHQELVRLLDIDTLLDLNKVIVGQIRDLRHKQNNEKRTQFSIGSQVSFRTRDGHKQVGVVKSFGSKNIIVECREGIVVRCWRVPPSMLSYHAG